MNFIKSHKFVVCFLLLVGLVVFCFIGLFTFKVSSKPLTVSVGESFDIDSSGIFLIWDVPSGIEAQSGAFLAKKQGSYEIVAHFLWKKAEIFVNVTDPSVKDCNVALGDVFVPELSGTQTEPSWSFADSGQSVLSFDDSGFHALDYGKTDLKAIVDGRELVCHVSVLRPSLSDLFLNVDETSDLQLDYLPAGDDLVWSVANESVADISEDGVITGLREGSTLLMAKSAHVDLSALVTVSDHPPFRIVFVKSLTGIPQILRLEGYDDSCEVKWVGAEDNGHGTASFVSDHAGTFPVSAIVKQGSFEKKLDIKIPVYDRFLSMDDWIGCKNETFELSVENGLNPVFSYDKSILSYDGEKFTALKVGETDIEVKDSGSKMLCHVRVLNYDSNAKSGSAVIDYALQFLGNPYVWGGTDLLHGTDCSGFVMRVYEHFGVSLPRTSYEQRSVGTEVSSLADAVPGDIVCYDGHVALYMGEGKIVHASSPKTGIKISDNAAYRRIVTIRRVFY